MRKTSVTIVSALALTALALAFAVEKAKSSAAAQTAPAASASVASEAPDPPKVPLLRKLEECERDRNGNLILLPRAATEKIAMGLVVVKKGDSHPAKSHPDEEEAYFILKGEGLLLLGEKKVPVSPGMTIYIPRDIMHSAECTSDEDLEYIYFACWP